MSDPISPRIQQIPGLDLFHDGQDAPGIVSGGDQSPHDSTHGATGDRHRLIATFFQGFQNPDVGKPAGPAATQHQSNFHFRPLRGFVHPIIRNHNGESQTGQRDIKRTGPPAEEAPGPAVRPSLKEAGRLIGGAISAGW